ncbi:DegV family protein [Desemzia sp. RIT804]|uniref:DegV family protein n=1 Tax=Desemzia sp. RIT 804 TaxID=2810209 RepID=UPI00194E5C2D|nr:DegV family protein [Desemzia sp. RIT 804]MBM6613923.1 DegV family protein [Desemzia sp. RIT 804]
MNKEKIAFLVDSGSDVPKDILEKGNMKVIPLKIIYKDGEYTDKVDIQAEEIYDRLKEEIPKTSLPDGEAIKNMLLEIKEEGYTKVIAITISSGLSGTNNMVRLMAEEVEDLDVFVLDTKNIGIGSGLHAERALTYVESGMDWETIKQKLRNGIEDIKVHFYVDTLEYLQKGGRIGLVSSLVGNLLNLKPVISCNEDGIYYTVAKARGSKKGIQKLIDTTIEYAQQATKYDVAVCYAGRETKELADTIAGKLKEGLPNIRTSYFDSLSPALGVHTGPGLIGIAVSRLEN